MIKRKLKSKTLWFNWLVTTGVTAASVVIIYLPEIGLEPALMNKIMMGIVLFTTFGNKYLRGITTKALK